MVVGNFTTLIPTHSHIQSEVCELLVVQVTKNIAHAFHIFQISQFAIIWIVFIIITQQNIVQALYIN